MCLHIQRTCLDSIKICAAPLIKLGRFLRNNSKLWLFIREEMVKHEQGASKGQDHTIVEYRLFKGAEMLGLIHRFPNLGFSVGPIPMLWVGRSGWPTSQNVVIYINKVSLHTNVLSCTQRHVTKQW